MVVEGIFVNDWSVITLLGNVLHSCKSNIEGSLQQETVSCTKNKINTNVTALVKCIYT